ncbi:MAG: hypothetical protein HYU67_07465 [Flavobacteriia bacterium]|nr:hypothetical protein [Flavobacteriia bacterium]
MIRFNFHFFIVVLISILSACSTEKNTFVNRTYHGTTAKYNGHFNANELLNNSLNSFRSSVKEDYQNLIPIELIPGKNDIPGMLPSIDTAIAKCKKVISNHSMPSISDKGIKKNEFNSWIDENWMTIGIANYYKSEYDVAIKSFTYIQRFFSNDPTTYLAAVWIAKSHLQNGDSNEAQIILKKLDKTLKDLEEIKKEAKKDKKGFFSFTKKKKKKGKEEEKKAEFTKDCKRLFALTKAELLISEEEYEKAIDEIKIALAFTKKSNQKARLNFLLAQLYQKQAKDPDAVKHYTKLLKQNAPFEMAFTARINRAILGGDSKLKNELIKMLRDQKNADYKDQLYFALAEIAYKEGDKELCKTNLNKAIFYSTANNRQKAQCYERLGDFSYEEKNYVYAQKYYDSCVQIMPETYKNAFVVKNKSENLKALVIAVETAQFQDSVLRLSELSPEEQIRFAEKLIKKIKEDEERKKRLEEEKLKLLQAKQLADAESKSKTKFFWNNSKTRTEGLETFRKVWGQRENEDDWRRNDKIKWSVDNIENPNDSLAENQENNEVKDTLSVETLIKNIPIGDSSKTAAYTILFNALFDAGIIYKDQLNEEKLASQQFEKIVNRGIENKLVPMALFQLYKIYETKDPNIAFTYKEKIILQYPQSDFAKYLNDPEYFVKQKQLENLNEEDFVKTLDRYNRGLYSLVISNSEDIIENQINNPYRSKYMLLTAMAVGQTTSNKKEIKPLLNRIVAEYPGTNEQKRANELLLILEKGVSPFQESNFNKEFIYKYEEGVEHWVIIFLPKNQNSMLTKTKIVDYNKSFFSKDKLNVSSKIFGNDQSVIVIKTFNEYTAKEYMREFKSSQTDLMDLQNEKMFSITQENLKLLFETQKLQEYEDFFTEFY